jgi:hypothetical protein
MSSGYPLKCKTADHRVPLFPDVADVCLLPPQGPAEITAVYALEAI